MFSKIISAIKSCCGKLNGLFLNLSDRAKPRKSLRWAVSFTLWFLLILYIVFGIFIGIKVYTYKSDTKLEMVASKFYPLPAAVIGNRVVWVKDYYSHLQYIQQFSSKTKQPLPEAKELRTQIVNQLIENKILIYQAIKYGLSVTNKDVETAYAKIVEQSGGETEVKKVLTDLYGMTEKQFKVLVKEQVVKEKIQNDLIAQVKVAHILIKDEARANEVAQKAKNGEDFAELAKKYSEDAKSRDAGGELGWLSKGQLVIDGKSYPDFDEAVFKANINEITGPVKTEIGHEIIKVSEKKGKLAVNFKSWLEGLKKESRIWRFVK